MAMTKNDAHQWALASTQVIPLAELVNAAVVPICELPADAIINSIDVNVEDALAGGTVTAGTLTFNYAAETPYALTTGVDITAAGKVAPTYAEGVANVTGEVANVEATVSVTGSGATGGSVIVTVTYVRRDRANEIR